MRLLTFLLALFLFGCNGPTPPSPDNPVVHYSTGLITPKDHEFGVLYWQPAHELMQASASTDEFDWEAQGFTTPVRDQGACGSCWAFAGTQSLEMAYKIFAGKDIDFSEQELVGNLFAGCGGGYFVYDYQISKGQVGEADCRYSASNRKCPSGLPKAGQGKTGGLVGKPDRPPTDNEMKAAIQQYGAITATVAADDTFMSLDGGFSRSCPSGQTNHMIALTGWKKNPSDGKTYFKIKNSWGTSWGKAGYSYVRLGCFNLAEEASFLAIDEVPCKPPVIKMPQEIIVVHGDEIVLAVKNIKDVTYSWTENGKVIGTGNELVVSPMTDTVYHVVAKNRCGEAEIQTRVTLR